MQTGLFFRCFVTVLLASAAASALPAQTLLEINTSQRCSNSGSLMDEELYRFPDGEEADALIRKILETVSAPQNFSWVQTNVERATAVLDSNKRYLLYSLDYLEKSSAIEKIGNLAHAIGHHAYEHTFNPELLQTEEIEANQFMGFVLYAFGFSPIEIDSFLLKTTLPSDISRESRQLAVEQGYRRAESTLNSASLPFADEKVSSIEPSLPTFPWPPPACNTRSELPKTVFKNCKTLGDAEKKLRTALDAKGYGQRSFFSVPNGYAIVTQLEQYNGADGSVRNDRTRWLDYPAKDNFAGLVDYLTSIVVPQKGYFRLFVYVVTDQPFGGGEKHVTKDQATAWLSQGFNKLPGSLAEMPFTAAYDVTTLVYEFEVPESNRKPVQKCPSPRFSAKTHLRKSGVASALGF